LFGHHCKRESEYKRKGRGEERENTERKTQRKKKKRTTVTC
jgi:hypothetical protein